MPRLVLDIWHGERGIDLEPWVRRHGLWGVIVKCGGSDDPTWGRYEETTWVQQVTQAHELGLHVGAYYYSDALTAAEAIADADHCVNDCMRGMRIDMPIYLDIEERSQLDLPMYRLTEVVTAFCNRVRSAGYDVGVYSTYEGVHNMFESEIASYSLWATAWRTSWPIWAQGYDLWQEGSMTLDGTRYHRNEDVDGPGRVDLDWASDEFVRRVENGGGVTRRKIDPANVAALIHYDMVTDPRNGYSQDPRWGGDHPDGTKVLDIDGHRYEYELGSYDCSSSTATAWRQALRYTRYEGALGTGPHDGATCTSDFNQAFSSTGLFRLSLSPARRGDLYNNPGDHVAMCQDGGGDGVYGYDCLSEFNRNEHRTATGGKVGDQDGGESVMRAYYDRPWQTVIHYVGGLLDDVTDEGTDDTEVIGMGKAILYDGSDDKVYYWTGSPESVPYHVSTAEKKAIQQVTGLELVKLDKPTAEAIMSMCKARKAWREQGIADAVYKKVWEGGK